MKKILTLFMIVFVSLPSTIAVTTPIKSTFISKKTNIHKYQAPDLKIPHNEATVYDYGPTWTMHSRIRLNISMTGDFYNRFLARITASPSLAPKEYFIMMFTGDQEPYLSSEGKDVVNELKAGFIKEAKAKHIADVNYFYNLFVNGLKSNSGGASFKAVFTGENLKNNTYVMPAGYNQAKAETEFRKKGAILQFDFNLLNSTSLTGKVDNIGRIFPYIPSVIGLTYYYQDNDYSSGSEKKVSPSMMVIAAGSFEFALYTVGYLKEAVRKAIRYYFNLPLWFINAGLIRIPKSQDSISIPPRLRPPKPIIITFFDFDSSKYVDKTIKLYRSV